MIKIINSANETQAILDNVISPIISEGLNREYTFDFSTVIDGDKSQYITSTNKIEVEDNYFNISYFRKSRSMDGIFLDVSCEHVSYDLLSANFTAGFTATGLFSAVATTLLSGTGFTIGTVEITASETISVNENTNAFSILKQLATLYNGELQFSKYQVNLLTRRGADNGVQFRYRKNISSATVIVDGRQKTAGVPKISYEISPAELEFEQDYISNGLSSLEHYELGDTIKVIDSDLGLDTSLRIVKESHDTEQRGQGTVEISNFVDDLTDTITNIQTTSVAKDAIYNGNSIGPENGFVSTRSDDLVKTSMNATNGITIQLRPSTTASYTDVFYVQIDTAAGTANLFLAGDSIFQGVVSIGSGNNIFVADGNNGIWLGNASFGSAPFRVNLNGALTAQNAQIIGDILAGSTFTVATGSNTIRADSNGLYVGSSAFTTAPFKSTLSGAVTATDITMTGNSTITGGTITGGTIQTATTGRRIRLNSSGLQALNGSNQEGFTLSNSDGFLRWYTSDVATGYLGINLGPPEELLLSHDYLLLSASNLITLNGPNITIGQSGATINFDYTTMNGLTLSTQSNHNHGIPDGTELQTTTGTITFLASGSHSHTFI